jgi:phosphate transport system substrate-binding protein
MSAFIFSWSFTGCKPYKKQEEALPDSFDRGTIRISADESFKPVIDAQVQVYESNRPGTKIIVDYKPEADCLRDMLVDSVRVIIATRMYSPQERNLVGDSLKIQMHSSKIARDAIAIIMHPDSEEQYFRMQDIRDILKGKFKKNLIPVFDGVKATSTVRFIIDSVLRGDSLTRNAVAAKTSEEVIDYISRTKNAVGFIGVGWIANKEDSTQAGFLKKVKVLPIESFYNKDTFVMPVQSNIFNWSYPMVRDLVYILKETHDGLGKGFTDFLTGENGQLIFKRAYLAPAKRDFRIREARLIED